MGRLIGTRGLAALRMLLMAAAGAFALAMVGCSISDSISDSISSPFKWSSDSSKSSSGETKESYRGDVRDYTEAYVRSSNDIQGFRKGMASIAEKHGISNWEADTESYRGIGQGLGKAEVKQAQLEVYKTNLADGDPAHAAAMQKGYEQYKN